MAWILPQLLALALVLTSSSAQISKAEEDTAEAACRALINANNGRIAGFVRLSFHDCVGHCDGCLNLPLTDPDNDDVPNAGLNGHLRTLANSYSSMSLTMSRADYFALCGAVAARVGQEIAENSSPSSLPIVMEYGRIDAPSCDRRGRYSRDDHLHLFPNPRWGFTDTKNWCLNTFGLNETECVALLGAHTLGRTRSGVSGYDGPWTRGNGRNKLDNEYFAELNNVGQWGQVDKGPSPSIGPNTERWQYVDNDRPPRRSGVVPAPVIMMLNTDMCLAADINPDPSTGQAEVDPEVPPASPTKSTVEQYANDNSAWLAAFWPAYKKMIDNVASGVTLSPAV